MKNNRTNIMYLHDAMRIVLKDQPEKTMPMEDLSEEIWKRKLYKQKNRHTSSCLSNAVESDSP